MLHAESAAAPGRLLWWVHSARDGGHHPFADEARARLARLPDARAFVFFSQAAASDRLGVDYDAEGRLDLSLLRTAGLPLDAVFYFCGPTAYAASLKLDLGRLGVPADRIRSESFGPSAPVSAGGIMPHPPSGAAGDGPIVRFMHSGLSVPWSDRFANLLDLSEACDVPVRWSCRTGVCHNCECAVVDGEFEYKIEPVDRPPHGRTLLCCAVPKSDVVLEL
jgi:ferredoxin